VRASGIEPDLRQFLLAVIPLHHARICPREKQYGSSRTSKPALTVYTFGMGGFAI